MKLQELVPQILRPAMVMLVLSSTVFALALLVHAFSMSSELRLPVQAATSIIAMVCALFLVLATLDGFVERRQGIGV